MRKYQTALNLIMIFLISVTFAGCFSGLEKSRGLRVINGKLTDERKEPIQLRGVSGHGIQWYPDFAKPEMIESVQNRGVEVFRIPVYPDGSKGYVKNSSELDPLIYDGIRYCIENNLYCILDWHVLEEESPLKYADEAAEFFSKISSAFPKEEHLIFEICNEPNGDTDYEDIRKYSDLIIPLIRENSPESLIIVGGINYASSIDGFVEQPLNYENVLYSLHYYPGLTDEDWFKDQIREAERNNIGVFVTEWGFTLDQDDSGYEDQKHQIEKMLKWLKKHQISWINWSYSDKNESYSFFKSDTGFKPEWTDNDLTESGQFVLDQFKNRD